MVISLIDKLANGKSKATVLIKGNLRKCKRDISSSDLEPQVAQALRFSKE